MENLQVQENIRLDLHFSKNFDETKGNIIKWNKKFIETLDHDGQIIIQGDPSEQVIVHTETQSFCLKKINISTTFLIVDPEGTIHQEGCDFIQLEHYDPPYSDIYYDIITQLEKVDYHGQTWEYCMNSFSVDPIEIRKKWKISDNEIKKLANCMNMVYISQANSYLCIPKRTIASLVRELITGLLERNLLTHQISIQVISSIIPQLAGPILQCMLKEFNLQKSLCQDGNVLEINEKFIAQFVYLEMALAKKQYTKIQFNQIADQMLTIYLPAQFTKPDNSEKLYLYFLQNTDAYIFYDYMLLDLNIMDRLKMLNSIKKRWKIEELRGIFRGVSPVERGKQIELTEILQKKFRKFGDQYEIRMILPK